MSSMTFDTEAKGKRWFMIILFYFEHKALKHKPFKTSFLNAAFCN